MNGDELAANFTPGQTIDRRRFVAAGSTVLLAALAAPNAEGQQEMSDNQKPHPNPRQDRSQSDAGPENELLRQANPQTFDPPTTDHGEVPNFWNSFSTAHRRIQEGGWSRR